MKNVSVGSFKEALELEKDDENVSFISVCESVEHREKNIEGVKNVPLSEIEGHLEGFNGKRKIYIHCNSGNRSRKAIERLKQAGIDSELINVEGGIMAWEEAGFPINSKGGRMPLMRQVFLVAGLLILVSLVGYYLVAEAFLYLALLVGAGLTFSGLTGHCGLALLLSKMPWNK